MAADNPIVYRVQVDDNAHYMDESERRSGGDFTDRDLAIEACKSIVDESLAEQYQEGMSAAELLRRHKAFGQDPWIS